MAPPLLGPGAGVPADSGGAIWRGGYIHPKGVSPDSIIADCRARGDYSPDGLFEASKDETHPLHEAIWKVGDEIWAARGRREFCRQLLGSLVESYSIGGRTVEVRVVEFVKIKPGLAQWLPLDQIRADPKLAAAYIATAERLLNQALAKLSAIRTAFGINE